MEKEGACVCAEGLDEACHCNEFLEITTQDVPYFLERGLEPRVFFLWLSKDSTTDGKRSL